MLHTISQFIIFCSIESWIHTWWPFPLFFEKLTNMHPWWFTHIIIFFWWWYLTIFFPNIVTTLCEMCQLVLLPHFFFFNMAYCSISLHLLNLHNVLSPSILLPLNYSLLFSFHLLHCSSIAHSSIFFFYYFRSIFISIVFVFLIHCWFYLFLLTF
jgi:hypothetical protein